GAIRHARSRHRRGNQRNGGLPFSTPAPPALVVHIPHASLVVPSDVAAGLLLTPAELQHELLVMTDRYTDELFALPSNLATTITFPVSRLVVDPERFSDDDSEPMARTGMGVVYERTAAGHPLRHAPSAEHRRDLLARFYEPHHAALTTAVEAALATHGACLLLDGHSFPTRPLPYEDDQEPDRPDMCIGTDASHTPAWLRDIAVHVFEKVGWSVAVDRPFAGALVPMRFYRKDLRVSAVMIEVRRGLYMDEGSGARLPGFDEARERISTALRTISALRKPRAGGH
ncbi:MAG: N-formylglutamate amidohydrolase, partial [Polyangiaceae bacterium]